VAGAPPYFDPDHWLLAAEFGDVFSCRDGAVTSLLEIEIYAVNA